MFYIYYGNDRKRISAEIKKVLGEGYEIFDGENLSIQDLVNICEGVSLFSEKRKILIRDLTPARKDEGSKDAPGLDYYAELLKHLDTPHTIVIFETNTSKKKSFTEFKKAKGVKALKFDESKPKRIFEAADLAFSDGKAAVKIISECEDENDPYMFVGLLTAKLCSKYGYRRGNREKQALLSLAQLDMLMKTSKIDPWVLVKGFIMRNQGL